jgi:hypothetical protein
LSLVADKKPKRIFHDSTTQPDAGRSRPVAPSARDLLDDDRPTEIYEIKTPQQDLAYSRQQVITGSTIREMMTNREHKLSRALAELYRRAREDLPGAVIDPRASLLLTHEFEFERRVGYRLTLKLFDESQKCVEVVAQLDQDGRAIRQGSVFSKLISI